MMLTETTAAPCMIDVDMQHEQQAGFTSLDVRVLPLEGAFLKDYGGMRSLCSPVVPVCSFAAPRSEP